MQYPHGLLGCGVVNSCKITVPRLTFEFRRAAEPSLGDLISQKLNVYVSKRAILGAPRATWLAALFCEL